MFSIFRKSLTVRRSGGEYVDGVWQQTSSELTLAFSVQPASPHDLERLPEARRTRKAFVLFGSSRLRESAPNVNPDMVRIEGQWYEVATCMPWSNSIINHFQSIVVLVDEQ